MNRLIGFIVWALILWGVLLPVFMLVFELRTHELSGAFFDPIPTPWHLALLLSIPFSGALALLFLRLKKNWLRHLTAVVRGIALPALLIYLVAFGPIQLFAFLQVPLAVYGVCIADAFAWESVGLGLAVLAPLFGLISWMMVGQKLRDASSEASLKPVHARYFFAGLATSGVLLAAIEIPSVQRYSWIKAEHHLEDARTKEILLRLCYAPTQTSSAGAFEAVGPMDLFGPLNHILNHWAGPCETVNVPFMDRERMRRVYRDLTGNREGKLTQAGIMEGIESVGKRGVQSVAVAATGL